MQRVQRSTEWRWHVAAATVAAVLALGGARVADRLSPPSECRPEADLGPFGDDPPYTGRLAAWVMLRQASLLDQPGGAAPAVAPAVVPPYQQLEVGQAASWEVAVMQLDRTARTLEVDFGDGGPRSVMAVPPGTGACIFDLARSYPAAPERRVLRFQLTDHLSPERAGPAAQAFVDAVEPP